MKVKTIKRFKDKHTGKVHKVGDVFTVNKDRFSEIIKSGKFVEEFSEKEAETKKVQENEVENPDVSGDTEAKGDQSMQLNTFVDVEMADGSTVKCTLTFGYLMDLKSKNRLDYEAYNKVAIKGAKEEFDNLRILYTGYLCGLIADDKPLKDAMSFNEFIDAILPDHVILVEATNKLYAPKKAMASVAPSVNE